MRTALFRWLRVVVILTLVILALQFELGMAINLSPNLPSLSGFIFSVPLILQALQKIGIVGLLHAGTGISILLLAIINLVLALSSRMRRLWIFGVLAFLSTFGAVSTGLLFVLSGFQNDGYSHGMATNFLLTFSFFFIELYMLKPVPITKTR